VKYGDIEVTLMKTEEFSYHVTHTLQLKKVNNFCSLLIMISSLPDVRKVLPFYFTLPSVAGSFPFRVPDWYGFLLQNTRPIRNGPHFTSSENSRQYKIGKNKDI
jgi:hypothetical protein